MSSPTTVLLATSNAGKVKEFEAAFSDVPVTVLGLSSLSDRTEVEETGLTFDANAKLKAEGYSLRCDYLTVAEDSGIEVDALNGKPGVHSARFGGPGLSDEDRLWHLLEQIKDVPDPQRTARYRAVIAVARAGEVLATFSGKAEGKILTAPRGTGGFGYDPIFFHTDAQQTFAEIPVNQKQQLSHRGEAIREFLKAFKAGAFNI